MNPGLTGNFPDGKLSDINRPKKRISYEDMLNDRKVKLIHMNLNELEDYRQALVDWLNSIAVMTKEDGIKESRRQYLIGLRKHVVIPLIGEVKKAKKKINVQVCNGSKSDVLRRFMKRSAEVLPIETFQSIYGWAISEQSELDEN